MIFKPQQWYNNTAINSFNTDKLKLSWLIWEIKQSNNAILIQYINQSYCINYLYKNFDIFFLKHKSFLDDVYKKLEKIEKYKNQAITNSNKNTVINLFKDLDKLFIEWYWNKNK